MSDEEGENNFIDIEEDEEEGENQVSFLNYLINKMKIIGRRITIWFKQRIRKMQRRRKGWS